MVYLDVCKGLNHIGRLGEHEHRTLRFWDSANILAMYPEATVTVLHKRPGDAQAYPVAPGYVEIQDGIVLWTIQSGDLARVGRGQVELVFHNGNTIAKSIIFDTFIDRALDGAGDPPEPWESWIDEVTDAADRAEDAAELLENPGATAETLSAGSEATASYSDGTFHFGIPRGQQGGKGDPGDDYVITEEDYDEIAEAVVESQGLQRIVDNATDYANIAHKLVDGKDLDGKPDAQYSENNAEYFASQAAAKLAEVNAAGATQIAAIEAKGEETLESIPDDYTELSGDVDSLKSAIVQFGIPPEILGTDAEGVDLDISDADGNVLVRFEDGHIETKEFNSANVLQDISDLNAEKLDADQGSQNVGKALVVQNDGSVAPEDITIEVDNTLTQQGEAADAKAVGDRMNTVESSISSMPTVKSTDSNSDFDITDSQGNVLARFYNGGFLTKKYSLEDIAESADSVMTEFEFGCENRLANPLFTTREYYNSENPNGQIGVKEALIYGHTGTTNAGYRIPTIAVTNSGTIIVAGTHMENAIGDYGDFSIDIARKPASGAWSDPINVVQFDSTREDYGSVINNEFLVDRNTGRIYLFYGTEKPDVIWWEVAPEDGDFRYIYSDDDGVNWSSPVSLKSLWDTDAYDYCIPSCTKGITLTNGTLVVPCFCKKGYVPSTAKSYPLLLIKPPSGDWYFSSVASVAGIDHLDECAVVEGTTNNEIWLYCRPNWDYGNGVKRGYNKFIYNQANDTYTHIPCTFNGNRHNCFGIDRIVLDNVLIYLMTFTDTHSTVRENITLWASLDGNIWIRIYRIHKDQSAGYSAIDNYNGLIAVAYESASNRGVIAVQDITPISDIISDTAADYIVRRISVQDRMQMLFNSAKGID